MFKDNEITAGTTWRHKDNGNYYKVLVVSNSKSTNSRFIKTVVYTGINSDIWSRPYAEWFEKFKRC